MKKIIAFIFLLVSIPSIGQKNLFTKGLVTPKNYYTEIDFEYISEKIIIPVTIQNKTYRFLFDTGAPNLISAQIKNDIKTNAIKSINIKDATSKRNSLEVVSVPEITMGGISFKNCPTLVDTNKQNFIFDCFEIDGIIGSNMLQKSIVQIDLKAKVIRLTNNKKKLTLNKGDAAKLYLIGRQKSPYIWINLHGEKKAREHLLIDTGMKGFYDVSLKNFNALQKNKIFKVQSEGLGSKSIGFFGAAKKSKLYRVTVDTLKINHTIFKNVTTETTNDDNSRIGSEALKHGIMTIDFLNKKFYFSSYKSTIDLKEKLLGFSPTVINNKLVVGVVWDKNLKNKISFGDEIIKLNTLDVPQIDICDFITSKTLFPKKDTVALTIKTSKGFIKNVMAKRTLPQ
ncbi:retropepsin-like aspartic protease [Hwangdonia lutea]|uniref:Retropepsin-like aspartic protease n=1 Tax=Hwangdonia lutea TaxID=3075823 RepID=A0AA97HQU0_9FLAO|nr:retropepsin-like aspartic protease [Hwangdonia sp. SCSIO 19198]WOD43078.1 retropepsin-like aspartic protease [Hwangdonia sp. SCSIO 19198]